MVSDSLPWLRTFFGRLPSPAWTGKDGGIGDAPNQHDSVEESCLVD
jgi:hypothetical protein